MRALLRGRRRDDGAAAVEFALLLPIFVILCVGTLSAGLMFWHNMTITQAARDAARYGTTLPISAATPVPAGEVNIDTWLSQVHDLAKAQAFGSATADLTSEANGSAYICVAYVRSAAADATNTGLPTKSLHSGVDRSGYNTSDSSPCFTDNRTDARVQVLIRRDGRLLGMYINRTWELITRSDIPYERTAP